MFWTDCLCFGCGAPCLLSGFYAPSVRFGSCHIVASSLVVRPCRLKYDWTLIQRVICHPVAGLPDYRCFTLAWCSHLWGFFIPLRCDGFSHGSILSSWYDLLDPFFASFALVKMVPVNLCPLLIFDMCDYLVITGGMISRCRVLTFTPLVTLLLQLEVLRLSPFLSLFSSSLCASVCTCVACLGAHSSSASPVR